MATDMTPPATAPAFLADHGWAGAKILPVAGDASFRRYFRVEHDRGSAILMDAPPPHEDPRPFISIARHLKSHNFGAPEIFAEDLQHGLVLLQDFGNLRMREHLDEHPEQEEAIYSEAVAILNSLHARPAADLPPYGWAEYWREVQLLTDWYCDALSLSVDRAGFETAWRAVLAPVLERQHDPVTVLRDYHAENIMLLDGGELGLLDFQDALAGHRAYDLVSLLQDARREVSPAVEAAMIRRYLDGVKDVEEAGFRSDYAVIGAQRNTKIIGIFTRLCRRDGKPDYLAFLPRMWNYLERDLEHAAMAPVAEWFATNIPAEIRRADPEMIRNGR